MKPRKFKLIKSYPNSENVGSVWTKREIYENYWYTNCYLIPEDVENNPEFFEEIIEKQYEILSFENKVAGKWINIGLNRFQYEGDLVKHLDFMLSSDSNYISSIRRLSDNEVFSIGDKTTKGIITKIEICDNKGAFGIYTDLHNCWNGSGTFEKAKPVLFVTKDSKEIKTGDEYWYVIASDSCVIPWRWKALHDVANWTHEAMSAKSAKKPPLGYVQFSSEEKAQEWIVLNKPVLSITNIMGDWEKMEMSKEDLIDIVKRKLRND